VGTLGIPHCSDRMIGGSDWILLRFNEPRLLWASAILVAAVLLAVLLVDRPLAAALVGSIRGSIGLPSG